MEKTNTICIDVLPPMEPKKPALPKSMGALISVLILGYSLASGATPLNSTTLVPTVYFLPILERNLALCPGASKDVRSPQGNLLATICKKQFEQCTMQGSCIIKQGDKSINLHFAKRTKSGEVFFHRVDKTSCAYGYGTHEKLCLDPYFSVAADLTYHKVGDVIYVPAVRGAILPDGSVHNGYFIVRDTGGAIVGKNRFDFYIGTDKPFDPRLAFSKLKLNDRSTEFEYQEVVGPLADRVLSRRGYPGLPY